MRVRVAASKSQPAGLALARLLRITPREALELLNAPRVLPAEFDAAGAAAACAALEKCGVTTSALEVPPTASRCTAHPSLTGEAPCEDCRVLVCPLCLPHCRSCSLRRATAARWKRVRVAVLLLVLVGIASWGTLRQRRLDRRNDWARPLRVSVILVSNEPVESKVVDAWRDGLSSLDDWFAAEAERRGVTLARPLHFELAPVVVEANAPSAPGPGTGEWLRDSQEAMALRSELKTLAAKGNAAGVFDVQLIVALRTNTARQVEGLGEAGGTIGLVDGNAGDTELTLELVALAHELLHCLGANDAYDARGHALARGIVEPELGMPQRFAEVMVGEVPLSAASGRIPKSLEEVRIGDETAREIGWQPPLPATAGRGSG
jgi:hypothetical protein